MFGKELLEKCVGLNVIFIRSNTVDDYVNSFSVDERSDILSFCRSRAVEIIEAVRPKKIVAIGFDTLKLFGGSSIDLKGNESSRVLAKKGSIAGRHAIGVLHLSGARISTADRSMLANHIQIASISS
jgi:hypothetical protein